jgi:hypothetical protein
MNIKKVISMNSKDVLCSNRLLHEFIKKAEQYLNNHHQPWCNLSKQELEGIGSISFNLHHLGKDLDKSRQELRECKTQLQNLRLDLKKLEPLNPDATPIRQTLDELMDSLEITKDYNWLETHFPGANFREGVARFFQKDGDILYNLISTMTAINRCIDDPNFHFKSVGALDQLYRSFHRFLNITRYEFKPEFWSSFKDKSIIAEGSRILQTAYTEIILKPYDFPCILNFSKFPKTYDNSRANEVIKSKLIPIAEHLCLEYTQLKFDSVDEPPNIEFMLSFPEVRQPTLDDPPVRERKLRRMLPSEPEITIYI